MTNEQRSPQTERLEFDSAMSIKAMKAGWHYLENEKDEICEHVYGNDSREVVTFEMGAQWQFNQLKPRFEKLQAELEACELGAAAEAKRGDELQAELTALENGYEDLVMSKVEYSRQSQTLEKLFHSNKKDYHNMQAKLERTEKALELANKELARLNMEAPLSLTIHTGNVIREIAAILEDRK